MFNILLSRSGMLCARYFPILRKSSSDRSYTDAIIGFLVCCPISQNSDGVSGISHIVIDEVHERDLFTDCLLVVVREILERNKSLRVIIMSATLDSDIYTRYSI
jgi:CRISPR/Cas system-associated endonuclease/helicase Cas3